jgi:hypothetical protein
VDEYLDTSLAYSAQAAKSERTLTLICELVQGFLGDTNIQLITTSQVSKEFPILLQFEDNWVVHDYLRIYLKNSAQKAKKKQQKGNDLETVGEGKVRGAWATKCLMFVILMGTQPIDTPISAVCMVDPIKRKRLPGGSLNRDHQQARFSHG